MKMPEKKLALLLSFLTGLFWAMTFIGIIKGLFSGAESGFFAMIATALFWAIPGILGVVFVEFLINSFRQTELIKEQNRLLKQLLDEKRD